MIFPNMLAINAAKYYYAANHHQTVRHLHDLGGGLVLTLPLESDLRNEESGRYIRKYLHTKPTVDVEQRMADAYGGWQLVVALQADGALVAQQVMMNRTYNMKQAEERALRAAGVLSNTKAMAPNSAAGERRPLSRRPFL